MPSRSFSFITFAGVLILAMACGSDNPAGPGAPSQVDASNGQLGSAIKSDIAAAAGNAIASDIETLIANEAAAVGSFAVFVPSSPSFGDDAPAASPSGSDAPDSASTNPPTGGDHPDSTASNPPSEQPHPQSAPQPAPVSESCTFNAAALIYSCVKSGEGQSVVKSYQFLVASGKPMEKFVKGVTEAIHFLVKKDASETSDNASSVSHSLRDVVESGFLGPNRIYNGFGSSTDTSSHKENLSTRKYAGSSVDSLKAVTFVDERAQHPYPLSGVAIRVVDYSVVSTGEQLETTTVHKRVVVTFNGTADVPISLGDYSCVLHLDTHKVDGCK